MSKKLKKLLNKLAKSAGELNNPQPIFNLKRECRGQVIEFVVRNGATSTDPVEVMIYDAIGKDPWSTGGISSTDVRNMLAEAPKDRDLHIRVNSKGGDVHEGMAIRNAFSEWPKNITVTIDGVAASTASWIAPKQANVRAYKNSQIFAHDAIGYAGGNADDFRDFADSLDKTSDQIASMYSERTGKGARTMRQMMKDETLMTGEEAMEMGLVDEIIDGAAVRNFLPDEVTTMKNRIRAIYNSVAKGAPATTTNNKPVMTKEQMLALLKEHGVNVANDATDEQLQAALKQLLTKKPETDNKADNSQADAKIGALEKRIAELTEANDAAKKLRITGEVEHLIANDQLPGNLKDKAIARAMKDEEYLNELKALPSKPPGGAPLSVSNVELTGEKFSDVQNYILNLGPRFSNQFCGANAGKELTPAVLREFGSRAQQTTNTYRKHRDMLRDMYNTNNIDADLQRIVLLQEMLEEFVIPLLPLQNFSSVFSNVPLEGTDKVGVPFYPLQTAASQSWNPATGYNTFADSTTNIREVAVGGSGLTSGAAAAANTAKDRKYLGLAFDSYTLRRQPFFNAMKLSQQNANKLAVDVFSDIVSRVITAGNYGASGIAAVSAAAFTGDNVADLWEAGTGANWPATNRSLVLTHTYLTPLLKDPTFKQYLAAGNTEALRQARISNAYGFENINVVPNLTSYSPAGENLVGWINWLYAALVATAPIMPSPEVRNLLTRYDIVSDPKTGISFEYRQMANATLDQAQYIVECNYGAVVGVASALKRIVSP